MLDNTLNNNIAIDLILKTLYPKIIIKVIKILLTLVS